MKISVKALGKRYQKEWIFRNLDLELGLGDCLAIIGSNGAGKSTLMQVLAGVELPSDGKITYSVDRGILPEDQWHEKIAYAAPYVELIEEFTLEEAVQFHRKFKPLVDNMSTRDFLEKIELYPHKSKSIKKFSSGMRQRLKLGLCFFSTGSVLFLDEPGSNLDESSFNWYLKNTEKLLSEKIVLIASNEAREYPFFTKKVNIMEYKQELVKS